MRTWSALGCAESATDLRVPRAAGVESEMELAFARGAVALARAHLVYGDG
jgi:hypothetical protein